jgi:predicted enzyme related to lactoylglutathione lyase
MSMEKYNSRPGDVLVNIDVSDLGRGVAFYTSALQLKVGRKLGTTIVELLGGNTALYLIEKAPGSQPFAGATASRDYHRHWTPVHLDFVVSDLEIATKRAVAAGAKIEGEPTHNSWGKLALFSDPFGNGFCLVEFSAEGYDVIAVD